MTLVRAARWTVIKRRAEVDDTQQKKTKKPKIFHLGLKDCEKS